MSHFDQSMRAERRAAPSRPFDRTVRPPDGRLSVLVPSGGGPAYPSDGGFQ